MLCEFVKEERDDDKEIVRCSVCGHRMYGEEGRITRKCKGETNQTLEQGQLCELRPKANAMVCSICGSVYPDDQQRRCSRKSISARCAHRSEVLPPVQNELCGCRDSVMPMFICTKRGRVSLAKYKNAQDEPDCFYI